MLDYDVIIAEMKEMIANNERIVAETKKIFGEFDE